MLIELAVPRIVVDHIDVERWGERRAALLLLIALLSTPGEPFQVTPGLLGELGRSPRRARDDRDTLAEMARSHVLVLSRVGGPHAASWTINENLGRWRDVEWSTSRRRAVQEVLGRRAPPVGLRAPLRAGQSVANLLSNAVNQAENGLKGRSEEISKILTRTFPAVKVASVAQRVARDAQTKTSDQQVRESEAPNLIPAAAPSYSAFGSSNEEPSFLRGEGGKEGISAGESEDGRRLVEAVQTTMNRKLWGTPRNRIAAVADANPDRLAELIDVARSLTGVRVPDQAARLMEQAGQNGQPAVDPAAQRQRMVTLQALIDTYRKQGLEDSEIEPLEAELAPLQKRLAVTTEG